MFALQVSSGGLLSTIIPAADPYLYDRHRFLTGFECLVIQGYPRNYLQGVISKDAEHSDRDLMDLAGNSFSGNIMLAFAMALITCFPKTAIRHLNAPAPADDCGVDDIAAAVSFLDDFL